MHIHKRPTGGWLYRTWRREGWIAVKATPAVIIEPLVPPTLPKRFSLLLFYIIDNTYALDVHLRLTKLVNKQVQAHFLFFN